MAEDQGTRDAEDVDRPSAVFPVLTTPTAVKRHARPHRGIDVVPSSSFTGGRFGRMFRNLPVFELSKLSLLTPLAQKMVPAGGGAPTDNPDIPAGYTYLGQFIDHDITFDTVSSLQRQNDPDALHSMRTPRFDLDSLYGRGPSDQPYLYADGVKLLLGESVQGGGPPEAAGPDLPRNQPRESNGQPNFHGRALIGDPRNDENLIVSQLHLTMLKFHNAVVDHVTSTTPLTGDNLFKEAQRLTRWHYQWVVVHDFLRRIVGEEVVADILRPEPYVVFENGAARTVELPRWRPRFYEPHVDAYMPVEFSVAAYRFGHSMVRGRYHINTFLRDTVHAGPFPIFGDEEMPANELTNLNGFRRLPDSWGFEWQLFFEMPGAAEAPQLSLAIDPILAGPLGDLPRSVAADPPHSLAERNLQRGVRLGLPSGTSVARRMGREPLTPEQLDLTDVAPELQAHPPLWYYVLKEAQVLAGGTRLGPVGGRIVAEVLLGLLALDPLSYLRVEPAWRPQAPFARDDGSFEMPQLIRFALQP
jgi:hypothetical protein